VAVGEADRRADPAGSSTATSSRRSPQLEKKLIDDPKEKEVIAIFKKPAADDLMPS
jgi:hypothetical protein